MSNIVKHWDLARVRVLNVAGRRRVFRYRPCIRAATAEVILCKFFGVFNIFNTSLEQFDFKSLCYNVLTGNCNESI